VTVQDGLNILQQGGALAAAVLALWALLTGRVVTRREFDRLDDRYTSLDRLNQEAVEELKKQSATNARLVEMSFQQRSEAERIRRRQVSDDDETESDRPRR
jgi:hypothetical protein